MKSALRRLRNQTSPVPLAVARRPMHLQNTLAGFADPETLMRASGAMGTVFSIVSLYAEASARPEWKLYRRQPRDARRRYAPHTDTGSDQRVEVLQHAALDL